MFDLSPLRPWEWDAMDQQRWSELTTARGIWDREHRAVANQAAMERRMMDDGVGRVG